MAATCMMIEPKDTKQSKKAHARSFVEAARAKRIREAAREHETDNDPASFERAFAEVARGARKLDREAGAPKGEAKPTKETR
jgi:hypothetical protein